MSCAVLCLLFYVNTLIMNYDYESDISLDEFYDSNEDDSNEDDSNENDSNEDGCYLPFCIKRKKKIVLQFIITIYNCKHSVIWKMSL